MARKTCPTCSASATFDYARLGVAMSSLRALGDPEWEERRRRIRAEWMAVNRKYHRRRKIRRIVSLGLWR